MSLNATQHLPDYWEKAKRSLSRRDPIMRKLIKQYPEGCLVSRGDPFFCLMRALVGQQISVKAADSIWLRLNEAAGGHMTPAQIALMSDETLRSVGLSQRKVAYARVLQEFFVDKNTFAYWSHKTDQQVMDDLTALYGIGRWTAEMFLMFCLLRPNILPVDDIGLIKAVARFYHDDIRPTKAVLQKYDEKWGPWCSVATWYLWRALDPVPVAY